MEQAAWYMKTRALTEQTYVDEVEMEEEGIAELFMDDTITADVARAHTHTPTDTHSRNDSHAPQGQVPLLGGRVPPVLAPVRASDPSHSQDDLFQGSSVLARRAAGLRLWSRLLGRPVQPPLPG